jgi:hypothetical protein
MQAGGASDWPAAAARPGQRRRSRCPPRRPPVRPAARPAPLSPPPPSQSQGVSCLPPGTPPRPRPKGFTDAGTGAGGAGGRPGPPGRRARGPGASLLQGGLGANCAARRVDTQTGIQTRAGGIKLGFGAGAARAAQAWAGAAAAGGPGTAFALWRRPRALERAIQPAPGPWRGRSSPPRRAGVRAARGRASPAWAERGRPPLPPPAARGCTRAVRRRRFRPGAR